ncbi:response regulator [Noviherbaspirillum galbum]|uniref:Response regulator transcription factor n=1 Tax=Noviherbaspirillum galbum TaxID=2709383 RepID=A0A6B3SNE4_9BURK|nr:response regulator transcription factor [Noviherbaspirillum galbum]NEX62251.1 response regulator transcription factor [Noviherbaspirillum galbum]
MSITVSIVEDNSQFLDHFAAIIKQAPGMSLAGTAGTASAAIAMANACKADVYLVDLGLPDASGIEVIRHIRASQPGSEVLVITVFGDEQNVVACIEAGATGYLLKDSAPSEIEHAIREIRDGGSSITPVIARKLLQRLQVRPRPADPANALTDRENMILSGLAKGMTYKEIADKYYIAVGTVSHHVKNIYSKLAVHSRSEAVFEAARRGIISI